MDNLSMRRLASLSKHVTECVTVCSDIKRQLIEGESPTQNFSIEVQKLRCSIDRLVKEIQFVIKNAPDSSGGDGDELASRVDEFNQLQIQTEDLLVELDVLMKSSNKNTETQAAQLVPQKIVSGGQLPKLQMASFAGDILRWTEFWDRFTSVVDRRTDISDVDKLAYLVGSLESEAKQAIQGLELTNSNYNIAVQKLKERFGKPNLIVDAHYAALYRIPVAKPTTTDCRRALDEIERHLRTLENLGENVNHNQLRSTIMEKFPQETIYELRMNMEKHGYSVSSLRESLEKIVSARETSFAITQTNCNSDIQNDRGEAFTTEALVTTEQRRPRVKDLQKTLSRNSSHSQSRKSSAKFRDPYFQNKSKYSSSNNFISNQSKRSNSSRPNDKTRGPPAKKRKLECIYCQRDHYNDTCTVYRTVVDRKRCLKGRCFQCLRTDHSANECKNLQNCFHCGVYGKHNRSLCPTKFADNAANGSNTFLTNVQHETILPTVLTKTVGGNGNHIPTRIIFDTGSQRSYLTDSLAKSLDLDRTSETDLTVYTFGSMKPKHVKTSHVTLRVLIADTQSPQEISAYTVPRITGPLPANLDVKTHIRNQFPELDIASDTSNDKPADLLIGSDLYYTFITGQVKQIHSNLYLVQSKLGWIISGQQDQIASDQALSFLTYVSGSKDPKSEFANPDPPLNDDHIKDLWELETIGIKDSPKILEQDEIIEFFNKTTIFQDSRYHVKWPWMQYPKDLPLNLGMAIGRLTGLIKRLNPEILNLYNKVLIDQLNLGVIEIVEHPNVLPPHPVHYLSHHCVVQEDKTTKLRIVYDASAKIRGQYSLNEYLYKGPKMLEDLVRLIILFRLNNIAIVADVERAFLQIGLQPDDRDVTRFVWLKDVTAGVRPDNIIHYRFTRVPFGIVSSPFMLAATIKHHLSQTDKIESQLISESLYVDNLLCSVAKLEDANAIFSTATSTFSELSMNIREWNSNCAEFINNIPEEKRSSKQLTSVLGLMWNIEKDTLSTAFNPSILSKPVSTKRDTLKVIASLFDPCGFIAPLTLAARLLHQKLWRDKCKWDDKITQERLGEWANCVQILQSVFNFSFPRAFLRPVTNNINDDYSYEIHCFTDASKDAYAAVVYIRITYRNQSRVSFVMSRSRLTPLKQREHMSIPKLELLGVLIGVRLALYVEQPLNISNMQIYLWTDSQIVLGWIRSPRLLPPFVARRVAEIKSSQQIQFRYVPSNVNPADIATRVAMMERLPSLWTDGPQFLSETEEKWPVWSSDSEQSDTQPDCNQPVIVAVTTNPDPQPACVDSNPETLLNTNEISLTENISSSDRENEDIPEQPHDSVNQSSNVQFDTQSIKKLQEEYFHREILGQTTDLSRSLRLFIDSSGLLRCNAKLQNAEIPYDQKYPILLPRDSSFTQNVIRQIHEDNYHVGTTHTLALVRKQFWVPMGRTQVTKAIRSCKQCVKYGGGPYKLPDMPPLPKERVAVCPPFSYTGLDYFGPLTVLENNSRQKRWCVLFTCMAARAIHLELVEDMTSEEFLNSLRRFVAARGSPVAIVSDNALQFKLSSSVLKSHFFEKNNIQWRFIPELSPWHGGFYERLIGLVKNCLRRTLDKTILSHSQLATVIKEVEAVLNTRPLTTVGADLEHVLTPADFLQSVAPIVMETPTDPNSGIHTATKSALVDSWKKSKTVFTAFRSMFVNQYLTSLAERPMKPHKQPRVTVDRIPCCGDTVQVKEDLVSRVFWRVGQICEIVPSKDGKTRTARVKLSNGNVITRSISHLYPLEFFDEFDKTVLPHDQQNTSQISGQISVESVNKSAENSVSSRGDSETQPKSPQNISIDGNTRQRPRREAAELAKARIRTITENLLSISTLSRK